MLQHPDVVDAAAVSMPDERLGEKVCIYLVARENKAPTLKEIVSFLEASEMAGYKLPERVEAVREIPRNPLGKILKAALRKDIRARMKNGNPR